MAATGTDSKQTGATAEGGEDRISALPEAILEQVLSILTAHEAVRSSVLSRRWRVLWKSLPDLRITEPDSWSTAAKFNRFVNHRLLLRPAWSLRGVELCTSLSQNGPYSVDSNAFLLENIGCKESVRHVEERIGPAVVRRSGAQSQSPCWPNNQSPAARLRALMSWHLQPCSSSV